MKWTEKECVCACVYVCVCVSSLHLIVCLTNYISTYGFHMSNSSLFDRWGLRVSTHVHFFFLYKVVSIISFPDATAHLLVANSRSPTLSLSMSVCLSLCLSVSFALCVFLSDETSGPKLILVYYSKHQNVSLHFN